MPKRMARHKSSSMELTEKFGMNELTEVIRIRPRARIVGNLTMEGKKTILHSLPEQSGRLGDADRQVDGKVQPRDEGGECDESHVQSSSSGIISRSELLGRPSVASGQLSGVCASRRESASRNDATLAPPHLGEAFGPPLSRKPIQKRTFCHFDPQLSYDAVKSKVEDPSWVAKHAFLPFLHITLNERRYRRNKETCKKEAKQKEREIYFASHVDSHIYSYYASILQAHYERALQGEEVNDSILAYRSLAKTNVHFARDAFEAIRRLAPCTVIAMDLEQFFDSLDHEILKKRWQETLGVERLPPDYYAIYKAITRFAYCDQRAVIDATKKVRRNHRWHYTTPEEFRSCIAGRSGLGSLIQLHCDDEKHGVKGQGVPQGSPISATLANLYLFDFDRAVHREVSHLGGKYYRYSDDLLFIIPGSRETASITEAFIVDRISDSKVTIQSQKTDHFRFERDEKNRIILEGGKPLQYLGFTFDGKRVLIRDSSVNSYYRKIRKATRVQLWLDRYQHGKPTAGHGKFLTRFTNRGKRNFVQYALNASRVMNEKAIKRQIRNHITQVKKALISSKGES